MGASSSLDRRRAKTPPHEPDGRQDLIDFSRAFDNMQMMTGRKFKTGGSGTGVKSSHSLACAAETTSRSRRQPSNQVGGRIYRDCF